MYLLFRLQEVEASLHCIMSVQEAVDMEKSPQLQRLFSPEIFGRFPCTGRPRIRRTALSVIGTPLFRSACDAYEYPLLRGILLVVRYAAIEFPLIFKRIESTSHRSFLCGFSIARFFSLFDGCNCSQEPL